MSRVQVGIVITAILFIIAQGVYMFLAIYFWQAAKAESRPPSLVVAHLPTKCAPFYNDGTDAWINCMGVGKK